MKYKEGTLGSDINPEWDNLPVELVAKFTDIDGTDYELYYYGYSTILCDLTHDDVGLYEFGIYMPNKDVDLLGNIGVKIHYISDKYAEMLVDHFGCGAPLCNALRNIVIEYYMKHVKVNYEEI